MLPVDPIIDPKHLPKDLWDPTYRESGKVELGLLRLPKMLGVAYANVIDTLNLRGLSEHRDAANPPVGGISQVEADKHFAQAFDGSSARAQLALLDPLGKATKSSNNLIETLAGNRVTIADAPCGAGAATFSFLCNIAHLRRCNVLPREPLDVHLIGGEISPPARRYAKQLATELLTCLEEQAITLTVEFQSWDVTDKLSNTDLIRKISEVSSNGSKRLVIIANFNGFLVKERKQSEATAQLEELFRYCSGPNSYALWIEPDMNRATSEGGVFSWLSKLSRAWEKFIAIVKTNKESSPVSIYASRFELPLNPPKTARVGLSFMSFNLNRQ